MSEKRVISTFDEFLEESKFLPDPESDKNIMVQPKSALHNFFMEKALDHNIDDCIFFDDCY